MTDLTSRIRAAVGDAGALLELALELMQENAKLAAEAAALERRRELDADRSRRRRERSPSHVTSRDVTLAHVTVRDVTDAPSPPAPPLSSPTPLINPSSPPSPPTSTSAAREIAVVASGETEDEQQFYREITSPAFVAIAMRFLAGKTATARIAWVGRFRGAMTKPPHPTIAELADALEDLMTRPAADWTPTVFRTFVGRIRRDATREAERETQASQGRGSPNSAGSTGRGSGSDPVAEAAWMATLALLPKWIRREVNTETFDAMTPPMRAAISEIGGFQVLAATTDERRVWIKRDFLAAYHRAAQSQLSQPPEAQSA